MKDTKKCEHEKYESLDAWTETLEDRAHDESLGVIIKVYKRKCRYCGEIFIHTEREEIEA